MHSIFSSEGQAEKWKDIILKVVKWLIKGRNVWKNIVLSAQLCLTLCNPMDCSLPGSSVHGILQARILEWVAMCFSRRSSQPRIESCFAGRFFTVRNTREPLKEYGPENKQHGIPAKWSLQSPRETQKDALRKQVLSDLLVWYRVTSSINGFPASSIVNFEWSDT